MPKVLILLLCLLTFKLPAFEYEQQFENSDVCVTRIKIFPHEEFPLHRDVYPKILVALQGGILTRLEADGREIDVVLPTGVPIFRKPDPENELHRAINRADEPIEVIAIEFKKEGECYKTMMTSEGPVAYIDTGGTGFPVVMLHGSCVSSEVFYKQIAAFRSQYRVIAIDLPGHGRSSKPYHPQTAYTIPGHAHVVNEVCEQLQLDSFAVVGFSLGGNIALQWTELSDRIKGVVMVSSAPIKYSEEAWKAYPPCAANQGGYTQLTAAEAARGLAACGFHMQDPLMQFMIEDATRADPMARSVMVASIKAGHGKDETEIVRHTPIPLALIVGADDPALGVDYIKNLDYDCVTYLQGAKHNLVTNESDELNRLIQEFLYTL